MKTSRLLLVLMAALPWVVTACANNTSIARIHPEEVKGAPDCTECHSDSFAVMNHRAPDFLQNHKVFASSRIACAACHQESFCSDCHARREEIKPSAKYFGSPERAMPHRGDYLSQHKIDGRLNPAPCFKCHGRQNNERCLPCHR